MANRDQARLAKRLLKYVEKSNKKEATRKELIKQRGQILVIDSKRFKDILKEIFPGIETATLNKIWEDWSAYLNTQAKNVKNKERLKELVEVKKEILLKPTEHSFIIASYETIKKEKSGTQTLGRIVKQHYSRAKKEELKLIGGQGDKAGAQLGHEEAGRGLAASAVKTLKAEAALARFGASDNPMFQKIIRETKNQLNVSISHEQLITKDGKLRKKYIPILTWQKAVDNQTTKLSEEAAVDFLTDELGKVATLKGSTPLVDGVGQVLLGTVAPKKARVQGKRKKQISEKSKGSEKKKTRTKKSENVVRDTGIAAKSFIQKDRSKSRKKSLFSVMAMINQRLPETLEKNMRAPGLENRTGRFARSVKLTDVSQTRQGYPSFGYTYRTDPYAVFEVGKGRSPWATPERDPRKLIDASIREIAGQMALGRFYTRRV